MKKLHFGLTVPLRGAQGCLPHTIPTNPPEIFAPRGTLTIGASYWVVKSQRKPPSTQDSRCASPVLALHHFERAPTAVVARRGSPLHPRARCPRRCATRALLTSPSETRAPRLAWCHVLGAIFNPAVTTTAKSHTAGLPGRRLGRGVCMCARVGARRWRASGGMDLPKDERGKEPDNAADDRDEKFVLVTRFYVPLNMSLWVLGWDGDHGVVPFFSLISCTPQPLPRPLPLGFTWLKYF